MFDPYRKWLGIAPKDQPPNHYRLLGVDAFESDLDVIEGAADKQMGFVRQYQSGEHAAQAAQILNELAIARICLLKPASKAAYDAKLRQQSASMSAEPDVPDSPAAPFIDVPRPLSRKKKKDSNRSQQALRSQWMMIGGGIATVCVLLMIFMTSRGGRPPAANPSNGTNSPTETNHFEISSAKPVENVSNPKPVQPPLSPYLWKETEPVTDPAGESVDLLKLVDLKRDSLAGDWKSEGTGLISDLNSRLYLPVKLPEDYQLRFKIRRVEGADTLQIGFVMAGRQSAVDFDGFQSTVSGLAVDARGTDDNCTTRRGRLFQEGSLASIVMTVHPGHLHVAFDDKTIIDWFGEPQRLYLHPAWEIPSRESPFIRTMNSRYAIESASLVSLKPEPAPARIGRLERNVDVLPLIDVQRDVRRGVWAIIKDSLHSPEGTGKIYLPTIVPEEYTIAATVELPIEHQGEYVLSFGLIAGPSYFRFATTNVDTELDVIDRALNYERATKLSGAMLKPGIPSRIACTILKSGIRVEIDGRTVIDWQGDVHRLSMRGEWALADGRRLFLGTKGHMEFRDIQLGPAAEPPKIPEHPPLSIGKAIDLLALIDPARDSYGGTWKQEGTALRCTADAHSNKLTIPCEVPDEYKLTLRVQRIPGGAETKEVLLLSLPIGKSKAVVGIDGYASTISGMYIDYVDFNRSPYSYRGGPCIPEGSPHDLVIIVQRDHVQVSCDGTKIIDWFGNSERLTVPHFFVTPSRRLALGSWDQAFRFEKVELEPLTPTDVAAVTPLGAEGRLLPMLNPSRDIRKGEWRIAADSATSPVSEGCRLRLPAAVPTRYVFSAVVERKQGNSELFLGLLVAGRSCSIAIDGDRGHQAGIDPLDGRRISEKINLTERKYQEMLLPPNQRVLVRCVVLPDTIIVTCGEKEVIRWHGDPRRLSVLPELIPPNYSELDSNHLWLAAWGSQFVFRDLVLKPLSESEADRFSKSFSGVFPTTSQADLPLETVKPDR